MTTSTSQQDPKPKPPYVDYKVNSQDDVGLPCQATEPSVLRQRIMDSRIPKSESEHWACRHIESLERKINELEAVIEDIECLLWVDPCVPNKTNLGCRVQDRIGLLRNENMDLREKLKELREATTTKDG